MVNTLNIAPAEHQHVNISTTVPTYSLTERLVWLHTGPILIVQRQAQSGRRSNLSWSAPAILVHVCATAQSASRQGALMIETNNERLFGEAVNDDLAYYWLPLLLFILSFCGGQTFTTINQAFHFYNTDKTHCRPVYSVIMWDIFHQKTNHP